MNQPEAADFRSTIRLLTEREVQFVIIGGLAIAAHGSAYVTADLDICYNRAGDNIHRLSNALTPIHPTLRGAPKDYPSDLIRPRFRQASISHWIRTLAHLICWPRFHPSARMTTS